MVYGKPALAMAVNRYATALVVPQLLPLVSFDLSDLAYEHGLTITALNHLKSRIKLNYQRFMAGDFTIREVLKKPVELAQFALSLFLETRQFKLTQGIKIHMQSDIPMGCGMGSSAATILSILHAMAHHFQIELSSNSYYRLALVAENMQHGQSSGLDLQVSLKGGCILVKNGQTYQRSIPDLPLYLVNTGIPQSTTGECVMHAAHFFKKSHIGDDFAAVTEAMDAAIQANDFSEMKKMVDANHELLVQVGVVPLTVQRFIHDVKQFGGAAKICGAGAVAGEKAGIVCVMTDNIEALAALCTRYHYSILQVMGESRGVHIV